MTKKVASVLIVCYLCVGLLAIHCLGDRYADRMLEILKSLPLRDPYERDYGFQYVSFWKDQGLAWLLLLFFTALLLGKLLEKHFGHSTSPTPAPRVDSVRRVLYFSMPVGLVLGAFSWWVVSLVSDHFEPFDSIEGFRIGQAALCVGAAYFGYRGGFKSVLLFLLGAHLGGNIYAFIFGGTDQKLYFALGMITTLIFLVRPAVAGLIGKLAKMLINQLIAFNRET